MYTSFDGNSGIVHVTTDMCEDLGFETQAANLDTVKTALLRGGRIGEFNVINTKVIEGSSNFNLGIGVEEGIGKLFSFTKSRFDNLESASIVVELRNYGSIWVCILQVRV